MANGKQKIWVSDLIGDKYKGWHNEMVILDCGTGCGKTTFCLAVLTAYAESLGRTVLYLCNREKLKEQVEAEVSYYGYENITVTTYQSIQEKIKKHIEVGQYDYILADECHYFTTDALFNDFTDLSYDYIKNSKTSVVVYMSATAKVFFNHLITTKSVREENVFVIHKNYDYVDGLYFYKKKQLQALIDKIIEEDETSKIVVFCNSENRMVEMYEIYGETANYYCSRHTTKEKLRNICTEDCFESGMMFDTYTFKKRILFTTSALDNGVNLKDKAIKHIISELFDVDAMIQAFGRKRAVDEEDTCNFYVKEYSAQGIQAMLNTNRYQIEPIELYLHEFDKFCQLYGEEKGRYRLKNNEIIHLYFAVDANGKEHRDICYNKMKYNKYLMDNTMLEQMKNYGYMQTVLNSFEDLQDRVNIVDIYPPQVDEFLEYLKQIEGKKLFSKDREELKTKFESIGVKLRRAGINTFNGVLDDYYKKDYTKRFHNKDASTGKYLVDNRRTLENGKENPNRNKKYWILY